MRRHTRTSWLALAAAGWLLCGGAPAGAADVERVEMIGVTSLGASAESRRGPRDRALREALQAAVLQVAAEEAAGSGASLDEARLAAALGDDPFDYATRFRVLEDRGERPALTSPDPDAPNEYVVLAEVHVDRVRVRRRLASAGLLVVPSGDGQRVRVRIAVEELTSWGEVQAVRQLLRDVGARNAVPVEVERGRAVLEVDSNRSPERLLQELVRRSPATLDIQPLGMDGAGLRLRARVLAPAPPAAPAPGETFDTPGAERY